MGQSERNNFQASVRELLSGLDGFVSTRSVVGEPIRMGEATLIPLMDIQIATAARALGPQAASARPSNPPACCFFRTARSNSSASRMKKP